MRTFTYTDDSRIASISDNSVGVGSYSYGGFGTRTSKTENSVSNTFVRDGMGVTAPVLRDSNASYTAGVSERRSGDTTYWHSGLKNVEAQSDANETISAAASYDAFGNVISSTGTWQGPFGYAGAFGYQQDATGYKLLGHRYYDPDAGRFLTRDPAKDGANWWVYCESNPLVNIDPSGLVIPIGWALFMAGSLIVAGFIALGTTVTTLGNTGGENKRRTWEETYMLQSQEMTHELRGDGIAGRWQDHQDQILGDIEPTREFAEEQWIGINIIGPIANVFGRGVSSIMVGRGRPDADSVGVLAEELVNAGAGIIPNTLDDPKELR